MATRSGFRTLPTFKVKRLHPGQQFFLEAKFSTRQFVEITVVCLLLFRQHTAFTGTNTGTRQFRTFGQGDLGFFRQGSKTHIRDKQRDFKNKRLFGLRTDNKLCPHALVFHQGFCRHLRCHDL